MLPAELNQKYEVRGTLGAGAMGTVYDAVDRIIERRVAIKVVNRPNESDPEAVEAHARFRREAQAAGRLSHPNIVGVYDYGENATQAWIVMELVEGGSLKGRLDKQERFTTPEIVRIMGEVCAGLQYSHQRGVVHRDIKPGNIMLTPDGQVKIADFGIARLENSSMTQVGTLIGTPSYMAPEQFRGEPVDLRADIWAAGVMLYQLLTGEKPFEGGFSAVMHKALHTEPPPPSTLSVTTPRGFDAVISRALAKRPDDRFGSAAEFAEAIRAATTAPAAAPAPGGLPGLPGLNEDATVVTARPGPLPGAGTTPAAPRPPAPPAPPAKDGKGAPVALIAGGAGALVVAAGAAWFFLAGPGAGPDPALVERQRQEQAAADAAVREAAARAQAAAEATAREQAAREAAAREAAAREQALREAAARQQQQQQQQQVAVARLDLRAAAQALATGTPCSLIAWSATDRNMTLAGVVRRGDEAAIRRDLSERGVPEDAARLALTVFDGPYCGALDLFRPVLGPAGAAPTVELMGRQPLQKGDLVRFDVQMPDWPAHLYLAYFMKSGEVANLVPSTLYPAGARTRLGEPQGSFTGWEVDEPFGTDLAVIIASDRPLFGNTRPIIESQEAYLAALGAALRSARAAGTRVVVRPIIVETVARR